MRRFKIFSARTMAAAVTAAMLIQGTAVAGPLEELNEIMEEQVETAGDSLLEQTLGLSDLADALEDNGMSFQMKAKLSDEALKLMDLTDDPYAGECVRFGFQLDPNLEKWALTAGFGDETESLLDAGLYGEREQLALVLPQFYAGALALKAGNLKEQIVNSDLATILGMTPEDAAQIPDLDMTFYPDDTDGLEDLFGSYEDLVEEQAEKLEDSMAVEKTDADGAAVYAVTLGKDSLVDMYRVIFKEYMSVFTGAGMIFSTGANPQDAIDEMVEQMVAVMEASLPDEFTMYYEVRNNLVEKISFEMPIDTAKITEAQLNLAGAEEQFAENLIESIAVEELAPAGEASNASGETVVTPPVKISDPVVEVENEFKGTVSCEMVYFDPAQPQKGFSMDIKVTEDETQESITIAMDFVTETQGTTEKDTISMELKENGETIYSGTVYTATFDAATGDLDAQILVEAEDTRVELKFDGTFSDIEKGRGFVLTVDELSLGIDGEKLGLEGEVSIKADAGDVSAPADSRTVLELKQEELVGLVSEISANAYIWSMKFVPQTDSTVAVQ